MFKLYNSCSSFRQIIMFDLCFAFFPKCAFSKVYDNIGSHIHRCVYRHNRRPSSSILTSQVKVITTANLERTIFTCIEYK